MQIQKLGQEQEITLQDPFENGEKSYMMRCRILRFYWVEQAGMRTPVAKKKDGISGVDIYRDSQHPSAFAWLNVPSTSIYIHKVYGGRERWFGCSCRPARILLLELLLQSHKLRLNDNRLLAFNLAEDQLTGLSLCTLVTIYN